MPIDGIALKQRNKRIKASRDATRERRKTQVCRAFTCKIDRGKLNAGQRQALRELFLDAKRLYNDCILSDDAFVYQPPKDRAVMVRMPDHATYQPRTLTRLSQQQMQGIIQQVRDNIRALRALKKNGHKVGALKPVKRVDCIPLKQPGRTYRLNGGYIHVERIPGMMHLTGVRQLEGWEVGPAKLIRRASGHYIAFSCFKDACEYESEHPKPTSSTEIGGMDAGIHVDLTEADGTTTIRRYPDTAKVRYWARRMGKRDKSTHGWWKANIQYRREQERLTARRKHAAISERRRLEAKYQTLVIQDEQIASWKKRKGYFHYSRILHGAILGRLYAMLKTLPNVTVLDKWQPTTAWCRQCGRRTPSPVSQRTYRCAYCGTVEDRDVHAARNMIALKDNPINHHELRKPRDAPIGPYAKDA